MIPLLADENVPRPSLLWMREAGHDVQAILEIGVGMSDEEVLLWATRTERLLVTLDSDFGELVFVQRRPCGLGVLLLRWIEIDPLHAGRLVSRCLRAIGRALIGCVTVVDRRRTRQRRIRRG